MKLHFARLAPLSLVCGLIASMPMMLWPARAAETAQSSKPAISEEARTALQRMSRTLLSRGFSFKARTIRVYEDKSGEFLHVFHTIRVVVRRPNRLFVNATGDDGSTELFYDGKTVALVTVGHKKYARVRVPDNLQGMMEEVMGRLHVDFPLADLLTNDPGGSFLSGVSSGREINVVTIDGTLCRHFFFSQAGGIELELWLEKNDRALPRRLIVTYRALPDQPRFVAEFSNWEFGIHPRDSEFVFHPPAGATEIDLKHASEAVPGVEEGK